MATLLVNDRWAFTHIPKCGGNAVQKSLPTQGFKVQAFAPSTGHVRLCDFKRTCGVDPDKYEVVAIIRNPYARELSHWMYETKHAPPRDRRHRFHFSARHETVNTFVADPACKFTHFYEREAWPHFYPKRENPQAYIESVGYYRYWLEVNGVIPDNVRIVHLENIDAELSEVLGQEVKVTPANTTKHGEPLSYFDDGGKAVVNRMYWWAFQEHYTAC